MGVDGETLVQEFRFTGAEVTGAGGIIPHWQHWSEQMGGVERQGRSYGRYLRLPDGGDSGCGSGCWGVGGQESRRGYRAGPW